jgi:hypothetical protein
MSGEDEIAWVDRSKAFWPAIPARRKAAVIANAAGRINVFP